jgi:hypothetical protein
MRGASRKPIDDSSIAAGSTPPTHQRAQADLLRLREATQAEQRERAVLVDERHDVRDRGERDDVEVTLQNGWSGPRSACASFQTTPVPQRPAKG